MSAAVPCAATDVSCTQLCKNAFACPVAQRPCQDCRNVRILMKRWKEFNAPALFPASAVTMGTAAQPQQPLALLPPAPTVARPMQPASPTRAAAPRPAVVTARQPASPSAAEAGPAHAPPADSSATQQSGEQCLLVLSSAASTGVAQQCAAISSMLIEAHPCRAKSRARRSAVGAGTCAHSSSGDLPGQHQSANTTRVPQAFDSCACCAC